jgi:hypothetical protein
MDSSVSSRGYIVVALAGLSKMFERESEQVRPAGSIVE